MARQRARRAGGVTSPIGGVRGKASRLLKSRIEGLEELIRNLDSFRISLTRRNKYLRKAMNAATKPVLETAKGKVTVETGTLRRSLGRKVKNLADQPVGIVEVRKGMAKTVKVGNREIKRDPMRYSHLVEFGHGGPAPAPPFPYMTPAMEQNDHKVKDIVEEAVREAIVDLESKGRHRK